MTRYYLEITVKVIDLTASEVDALFEPLADAVYDLAGVVDADLGARFDVAELDFMMAVDAEDPPEALTAGLSAVRCAIHTVGGATPGWEDHFAEINHTVRPEPAAA